MRCQQYVHTKSYCCKPFVSVKYGGSHSPKSCTKTRNSTAKCPLCEGDQPANYRGCPYYNDLMKRPNNANNRLNIQQNKINTINLQCVNNNKRLPLPKQNITYANILKNYILFCLICSFFNVKILDEFSKIRSEIEFINNTDVDEQQYNTFEDPYFAVLNDIREKVDELSTEQTSTRSGELGNQNLSNIQVNLPAINQNLTGLMKNGCHFATLSKL